MGDVADMMLDGTLCEGCGVYLDGDAPGYPRYCGSCTHSPRRLPYKSPTEQKLSKDYKCKICKKRFHTSQGLGDPIRVVHTGQ